MHNRPLKTDINRYFIEMLILYRIHVVIVIDESRSDEMT